MIVPIKNVLKEKPTFQIHRGVVGRLTVLPNRDQASGLEDKTIKIKNLLRTRSYLILVHIIVKR